MAGTLYTIVKYQKLSGLGINIWIHSMGKVDCIKLAGLELWFNSLNHGPPHFHVRKPGEWEVRVFFLSCTDKDLNFEVKFQFKKSALSGKEKTLILREVLTHRDALLQEWEQKVSQR